MCGWKVHLRVGWLACRFGAAELFTLCHGGLAWWSAYPCNQTQQNMLDMCLADHAADCTC